MKRKALGKGLRSLIPQAPPQAPVPASGSEAMPPSPEALLRIDLDLIQPNPRQPRERIDDETLDGLARSLERHGVLQPVLVRPIEGDRFELVAGERRWRAAQRAGLMKIPAVVKEVADDRVLEYALVENLQREELNPIEEAVAYQTLVTDFGLTQEEIAERTARQRSTVANTLRLLNLPGAVQEKVKAGRLSTGHAKAILGLKQPLQQIEAANCIIRDGLSVRDAERLVGRMARPAPRKPVVATRSDPNVAAAEEELQREIGTRVRIVQGKKGAGRIEFHCFSEEELQRVYDLILAAARHGSATSEAKQ